MVLDGGRRGKEIKDIIGYAFEAITFIEWNSDRATPANGSTKLNEEEMQQQHRWESEMEEKEKGI